MTGKVVALGKICVKKQNVSADLILKTAKNESFNWKVTYFPTVGYQAYPGADPGGGRGGCIPPISHFQQCFG